MGVCVFQDRHFLICAASISHKNIELIYNSRYFFYFSNTTMLVRSTSTFCIYHLAISYKIYYVC